ncbi:MAG: Calx-beta domain-containing protein, partial [Actinomycetota bacterium]
MRDQRRWIPAIVVAGILAAFPILPAAAACHRFTFSESTYSVSEQADEVTLTVARDGAVNDSSVQWKTVNGTAQSPKDYAKDSGKISYSGTTT